MSQTSRQPAIVFHCPFPVGKQALSSANLARPVKMLSAFKQLGYQVEEVTGTARQRREKINRLKALIRQGLSIDFVYSETSNLPLFINEENRLPLFPFLEYRFFRWLRKRAIPQGLYLRDLHWRFPHFRTYPLYKRLPGVFFYWLDWLMYMSRCTHLFLPSLGLKVHLPTKPHGLPISSLPPGCDEIFESMASGCKPRGDSTGLTLFYVGGVTPPLYDLTPMFRIAAELPDETVVLCCRADEWVKAKSAYSPYLSRNVHVVHAQGAELQDYYRRADLFLLAWNSYAYTNFCVPYKLFESVANHLPIAVLAGTESARLVLQEGFGWVAEDIPEFVALIGRLRCAPELLQEKSKQLSALAAKHSWTNRARFVVQALERRSPQLQEFSQP